MRAILLAPLLVLATSSAALGQEAGELPATLRKLVDKAFDCLEEDKVADAIAIVRAVGKQKLAQPLAQQVADELLEQADELRETGKYPETLDLVRAIYRAFPDTSTAVTAKYQAGKLLAGKLKQPAAAIGEFLEILRPEPKTLSLAARLAYRGHRPAAQLQVSRCLAAQGRKAEALQAALDAYLMGEDVGAFFDVQVAKPSDVAWAYLDLAGRAPERDATWTKAQERENRLLSDALRVVVYHDLRDAQGKVAGLELRASEVLKVFEETYRRAKRAPELKGLQALRTKHFPPGKALKRITPAVRFSQARTRRLRSRRAAIARNRARMPALRAAAAKGDAKACYELAGLLKDGYTVLPEPAKALDLLRVAASKGHGLALWQLGQLSLGKRDWDAAVRHFVAAIRKGTRTALTPLWETVRLGRGAGSVDARLLPELNKAAAANDTTALKLLSWMHRVGRGVKQDAARARQLLLQAATRMDSDAQRALARMLADGAGGPVDRAGQLFWLRCAGQRTSQRDDERGLAWLRSERDLAKAARRRTRAAAKAGFPVACRELGWMQLHGVGGPKQPEALTWYWRALERTPEEWSSWVPDIELLRLAKKHPQQTKPLVAAIRKAAAAKELPGLHWLASLLLRGGFGVAADPVRAFQLHREESRQRKTGPCGSLSLLFQTERYAAAARGELAWARKHAAQGDAWAMTYLGWMHDEDRSVLLKDEDRAEALYRQAAAKKSAWAMLELARLAGAEEHLADQGYTREERWLKRAAEAGGVAALFEYGLFLGNQQRTQDAAAVWRRAAAAGSTYGMWMMAEQLLWGPKAGRDEAKAAELLRKAAKLGGATAHVALRILLRRRTDLRRPGDP